MPQPTPLSGSLAPIRAAPITTTHGLVKAIERATGRPRPDKIHPATRTFQALRMQANDEPGQLRAGLAAALAVLAPEGRLVVIAFHSIEDRIVKQFMREHGKVFWVLGIMQYFWYSSDKRREKFVKICEDKDVQQLTFESYMNKVLVRKKPMAHVRIFFKDLAHLFGMAKTG